MIVNLMRRKLLGEGMNPGWGMPFVTSFATHSECYHQCNGMLSQWRGYSGDSGVAIVLDTRRLEELLKLEFSRFHSFGCVVSTVLYYTEEVCLEEKFPIFFHAFKVFVRNVLECRDSQEEAVLDNLDCMTRELLPIVCRLKHRGFREEEECRIIVGRTHEFYRKELQEVGGESVKAFKPIYHRWGPCGSIPYIRLFEDMADGSGHSLELPITRIVVGPSRNQISHCEVVCSLVEKWMGRRKIEVQMSDIPYVGSVAMARGAPEP